MNAAWVWLFWSELPAGERRAGRAAAPRAPLPPRRPRRPLPPRCGGAGDGAATATMSHRDGPDRNDVTSLRFPGCRQPARRGTPERQVTPAAHDASPAYSLRRSHTHAASTPYDPRAGRPGGRQSAAGCSVFAATSLSSVDSLMRAAWTWAASDSTAASFAAARSEACRSRSAASFFASASDAAASSRASCRISVVERARQAADRLVLSGGDLRQRLAGAQLREELRVGQAEILGSAVESAEAHPATSPEEATVGKADRRERPLADPLLDLVRLRLSQLARLDRLAELILVGALERVVERRRADVEALGDIVDERLAGVRAGAARRIGATGQAGSGDDGATDREFSLS